MQTAIFKSESNADMKLLINLARKIGIKTKILAEYELEDIGLAMAVKEGKTGEYIETESYLKKLRK